MYCSIAAEELHQVTTITVVNGLDGKNILLDKSASVDGGNQHIAEGVRWVALWIIADRRVVNIV
jgi:hypothetical protein